MRGLDERRLARISWAAGHLERAEQALKAAQAAMTEAGVPDKGIELVRRMERDSATLAAALRDIVEEVE